MKNSPALYGAYQRTTGHIFKTNAFTLYSIFFKDIWVDVSLQWQVLVRRLKVLTNG